MKLVRSIVVTGAIVMVLSACASAEKIQSSGKIFNECIHTNIPYYDDKTSDARTIGVALVGGVCSSSAQEVQRAHVGGDPQAASILWGSVTIQQNMYSVYNSQVDFATSKVLQYRAQQ